MTRKRGTARAGQGASAGQSSPAAPRRITLSIPGHNLAYADRKAAERGTNRSEPVAQILTRAEEREVEQLMIEGYRAMAGENAALAEEGRATVSGGTMPP